MVPYVHKRNFFTKKNISQEVIEFVIFCKSNLLDNALTFHINAIIFFLTPTYTLSFVKSVIYFTTPKNWNVENYVNAGCVSKHVYLSPLQQNNCSTNVLKFTLNFNLDFDLELRITVAYKNACHLSWPYNLLGTLY